LASFEQHINISIVATGIIIVPLHHAGILSTYDSLISLSLGSIGGILPDLDSDNSKPVQIVYKMLSIFLPLLFLFSFGDNLSLLHLAIAWLISSIVLSFTVFKLFVMMTSHRGIFHSVPMGILFSQLTILLSIHIFHTSLHLALTNGFFIFYGFIIHLLLDELFSLNALGIKIKKSFGTAFKFYDKNNLIGTFILYVLIIILATLIPIDKNIYYDIFNTLSNVKVT
jgi:hypothetical protein